MVGFLEWLRCAGWWDGGTVSIAAGQKSRNRCCVDTWLTAAFLVRN